MTSDACIETDWPRDKKGYGVGSVDGVGWRAHRYAWMKANGPIPDGMVVCHSCDNPPCINPEHLWIGTHADNIHDRDRKGRTATGDRNGSRTRPESRPRGEAMRQPKPGVLNGRAKLTPESVEAIRRAYHAGITITELSREHGVSRRQVRRIAVGERWTHG